MIKFKNILNELEIQPNVGDPIKRKGLKIGDKIQFSIKQGSFYCKIQKIDYYKYFIEHTEDWQNADYVMVFGIDNYNEGMGLYYYKNPQNENEQVENKIFNSIQKIK